MPIIAKGNSGKFEPCPPGMQQAVCCDVVDLGLMETQWGQKHKIDIVWQSDEKMKDGRPYLVKKRYTLSLNERANLRHDLESWRHKPFTENEAQGFDVERLIGVNALLNVVHKAGSKGSVVFANVMNVTPVMKGMPTLTVSPEYVRVCNRDTEPEPDEQRPPDDIDDAMPSRDDNWTPF